MYRFGPGGQRCFNDFFPAQVTVFGAVAANMNRLVTSRDVFGVGVRFGINRHGFDGHAARSGRHTAGDFTAIGDQDFLNIAYFRVEIACPCFACQPI